MIEHQNLGFVNEFEFRDYLCGKSVKDVSAPMRSMLKFLYPNAKQESIIHAMIDMNSFKDDLIIIVDGEKKRISIKKGFKNSVHTESVYSFIYFLYDNGFNGDDIEVYLRYHFGDGTTDGTGKVRISAKKYKESYQLQIDRLNWKLNDDEFIWKAIDRFVLKGINGGRMIDGIIYGTLSDFVFITRQEIKEILWNNRNCYSTAPHVSGLTIQTMNRCLNWNPRYEAARKSIQVKWYNLLEEYKAFKSM